jgi:hypothetical protein
MNQQSPIDTMTADQERTFLRALERSDDAEAKAHLAAGASIVYRKQTTPPGHVIRKYSDGRRELRYLDGHETAVRELPPAKPFDGTR